MANPKKREQEQAFLILVDDKQAAAQEILDRDELCGLPMTEPKMHSIHDTYFDTPDNDLRMSTVTFRKRIVDGQILVSFKGKEKKDAEGKKIATQDHQEWEFPWPEGTPFEMVADVAGLVPVQDRDTNRLTRYLTDTEGNHLFEINLDNSLYTVSTGKARLFELEIERQAKMPLKPVVKTLKDEFDFLTPWDHGKFATGKALEFAFGVKTDEQLNLTPESFDYIEKMFKQLKVVPK